MATQSFFEPSDSTQEEGPPRKGSWVLAVGLIFFAAWILLLLVSAPPRPSLEKLYEFQVGEPAPRTVLAPFPFKYVDEKKTAHHRQEALEKVAPTFTRIAEAVEFAATKWRALQRIASTNGADLNRVTAEADVSEATAWAATFWNEELTAPERAFLNKNAMDPVWARSTRTTIVGVLQESDILGDESQILRLRPQNSAEGKGWFLKAPGAEEPRWVPTAYTIRSVTDASVSLAGKLVSSEFKDPAARILGEKIAGAFVVPTLEKDALATERDQTLAKAQVPSVSVEVKQLQGLVRRGETVTEEQHESLLALKSRTTSRTGEIIGRAVLIASILWVFFGYLRRHQRAVLEDYPRLAACLGQVVLVCAIAFVAAWGAEALDLADLPVGYLVPVATVGILVTLLENSRLGIFSVLIASLLIGVQFNWGFSTLIVLVVSALVGSYHVSGASLRSQIYLAFPWIFGAGVLVSTGVHLLANPSWQAFSSSVDVYFYGWMWLALNGCLSVAISLLFLPLLEDMLGVTTEFKLRELSVSHPLLRRLEEVAPGTYYHSLNVSVLAEAAASAIGANALLVKVAAYYHDIGKMEKPSYFAENQFTEEEKKKHSKISPHMSCLIIRNHVKIGVEMAREHRLPESLFPFIAEHHGTTLISYFYDTARAEDPHGTITESDFRYLGPKPQSVESAVLMIADTIEAASRSMKLVGEGEIRVFVRRMINAKMIDGQFAECPLTFKELDILRESFIRTLKTMMHRRIAYPSTPEIDLSAGKDATPDGEEDEKENVRPLFGERASANED